MHDDRLVADDFREVGLVDEVAVAGVDRGHASIFSMLEAPAPVAARRQILMLLVSYRSLGITGAGACLGAAASIGVQGLVPRRSPTAQLTRRQSSARGSLGAAQGFGLPRAIE